MTKRTKDCKKKWLIFEGLSIFLWIGVALFSVISIFTRLPNKDETSDPAIGIILSDSLKGTIVGLGITIIIAILLAFFISNKLRTTVYMVAVMICTILYGEVAMFIIFAIWFLDEYIFKALAVKYKNQYTINKEIDMREE